MDLKRHNSVSTRLSRIEHLVSKMKVQGHLYPKTTRLLQYLLSGSASDVLVRCVDLTSLRSIGLECTYGNRWWSHYEEVLDAFAIEGGGVRQVKILTLESLATWAAEMIPKQRTKQNHNRFAERIHRSRTYAQVEHFFYLSSNGFLRRIAIEDRIRELGPAAITIVDIGTGPSVLLKAALQIAKDSISVAVDLSKEVSKRSKSLASSDIDDTIWCVGLCQRLPIRSESTDLVLACEVIEHLSNPRPALEEIKRILRSDGHAIISVPIRYPSSTHLLVFQTLYEYVYLLEKNNLWLQSLNRFPVTRSASVAIAVCRKGYGAT